MSGMSIIVTTIRILSFFNFVIHPHAGVEIYIAKQLILHM